MITGVDKWARPRTDDTGFTSRYDRMTGADYDVYGDDVLPGMLHFIRQLCTCYCEISVWELSLSNIISLCHTFAFSLTRRALVYIFFSLYECIKN